ncbi:Helix-loop-helix DNA-binding domain protein [Oesophagostomum dentatum]|uniref:Helix-loop-helix DNA-binding domain protein n=1 Tax=Oesophagostomum dentatum TaxID=61180 RepID=A0A0B1TPM4_OESDE|nr:Helix-loop-helix DNA-binding domain protein [Oesophagostomum dentatum]
MDTQLSIKTLLTAARLLDGGHEVNTLIHTQPTMQDIHSSALPPSLTTQPLYADSLQPELRDIISRKMRVERKLCSASTSAQPYCSSSPSRKNSSKHSRAAHNELEKTRRANLRGCLETLKTLVPPLGDASRNTTLALLTRARDHIKQLEECNAVLLQERDRLQDQKSLLQNELERLKESTSSQSTSRPSSTNSRLSRDSPIFLEYSPSSKPAQSPQPIIIDPMAEGLLPALPICYPRPSLYPYLDLTPSHPCASFDMPSFLPIHLRV